MSRLVKSFFLVLGVCVFLGFLGKNSNEEEKNGPPAVRAEINKERVETGEIFSYQITIEGEFNQPKIQAPGFDNFQIVSSAQTKSFSYQKGKVKTIIKITYLLFCPKPGNFSIEPVKVEDGNQAYQSSPLDISVEGEPLEQKRKLLPYIESGTKI